MISEFPHFQGACSAALFTVWPVVHVELCGVLMPGLHASPACVQADCVLLSCCMCLQLSIERLKYEIALEKAREKAALAEERATLARNAEQELAEAGGKQKKRKREGSDTTSAEAKEVDHDIRDLVSSMVNFQAAKVKSASSPVVGPGEDHD